MSGIIDIRVITESPWKVSLLVGGAFFAMSSWNVPASILFALPGSAMMGAVRQAAVFKALLVAALAFFVLKYKRTWVLDAVSSGAALPPGTASKQNT